MLFNSEFEIVTLKTGIKSLRSLEHGETFHPGTGPMGEARILHVGQQRLVERCAREKKFVIWDVGFGAAANVLAAIEALENCSTEIEIHSFDKTTAPIEFALRNSEDLNYLTPHKENLQKLLVDRKIDLPNQIHWELHLGDFKEKVKAMDLPSPHAIFYDPYSSVENPELWSLEHLTFLKKCLDPNTPCLLTNYTRSTAVRVTFLLSGFFVGKGCEIGEKAETTLISNSLELLQAPLDKSWLNRVRQSTNAAPLRSLSTSNSPIQPSDFELLERCPQF